MVCSRLVSFALAVVLPVWVLPAAAESPSPHAVAEAPSPLEAGRAARQASDLRLALGHFRAAVASAPGDREAQRELGEVAELLGEFDQALAAYRAAVQLDPTPLHHYLLGGLAARMGSWPLAVAELRASRDADWHRRQEVAEALFLVLIEAQGEAAALDLARAEGWLAGQDYCDERIPDVTVRTQQLLALLVHPERAGCLIDLASELTDAGYTALPRRVLAVLITKNPNPLVRDAANAFMRARLPAHDVPPLAESLNGVGYTLARRGRDDDAIAAYRKAIIADPAFSWPVSNLGRVYLKRHEDTQALEWFRKAVALNPNHARALQNLGYAANRLGHSDEALAAYRQALRLDPDDAWTHANLGWALIKAGRETEGIQSLQTSLRLDAQQSNVRQYLNHRLGTDPRLGPTPFVSR